MSNFIKKKWSDVCTLEYGKGLKDYKNEDNDYAVYGSAGIIGTHSEYHQDKGVIVSRKGTLDIYYSDKPFFVIDTAFFLKTKSILNSKWAYYALKHYNIKKLTSGTSVPSLSRDDFYETDLLLPTLHYQSQVESILSHIDKKIELNKEMNETLEEIAKTLFRSWFIDFDPVRTKAEGRSTGLSKEISDLFPDSFEDSELGEIPKGWKLGKVKESFKVALGGTPSRKKNEYWNGSIPWINSGELNKKRIIKPSEFITQSGLEKSSTKFLPKRSTLIAITGATLGQVSLNEIETCANQSVVGILPSERMPPEYVFLSVSLNIASLISCQTGGAQQHINKNNVEEHSMLLPPSEFRTIVSDIFEPIFDRIGNNLFQNEILIEMRDILLPKLISGELNVLDAEKFIDEVKL